MHPVHTTESRQLIDSYAYVIANADGRKDKRAKKLACVSLATMLARDDAIDANLDKLAGCPEETIELAREHSMPPASEGLEDKHSDYIPIVRVAPVYPKRALSKGMTGVVIVVFEIGANGRVQSPRALASNNKIFEKPAIEAVRKFRYKPRQISGEAVSLPLVTTRITFQIEGESEPYTRECD